MLTTRSIHRAWILSLTACAAACSAPPDGAGVEATGETRAALVDTRVQTLEGADLDAKLTGFGVRDSTLTLADGNATFMPSANLASIMAGGKSVDPKTKAIRIGVPSKTVSIAGVDVTATPTSASVDMEGIAITIVGDALMISAHGSGVVHVATPVANPNLQVDDLGVTVALGYSPSADNFTLKDVTVTSSLRVTDCGFLGWCDKLLTDNLPDVNEMLRSLLKDAIPKLLVAGSADTPSQPLIPPVFQAVLEQSVSVVNKGSPWVYVPHSASLGGNELTYSVTHQLPGKVPQACTYSVLCDASVSATCADYQQEVYSLEEQIGAEWITIAQDTNLARSLGPTLLGNRAETDGRAALYRVCTTNLAGETCTAPTSVVHATRVSCGGGGAGGGSSSTCKPGHCSQHQQ